MPDAVRSGRLAGMRVLIVEDEMLLALDYESILEREGATVLGPAPDEGQALALFEHERPDAAILDLNLGGARPATLAEKLAGAGVPFVLVTGYGARQVPEAVFRDAPRLDKPLHPEQLVGALVALARTE